VDTFLGGAAGPLAWEDGATGLASGAPLAFRDPSVGLGVGALKNAWYTIINANTAAKTTATIFFICSDDLPLPAMNSSKLQMRPYCGYCARK
jgi:hypothetical protein